ncbi:MAG: cytochrome b [Bdellovibrionales bacterium]|jgi:cytochrome b561
MSQSLIYDPVAKTLHWGTVLAIGFMLVLGGVMGEDFWPPDVRRALFTTHKTIGILILLATFFRLYWLYRHHAPPLPVASMPRWQVWAARLTHRGLYALLIVIPLSGWALVSMSGHGIQLFGLWPVPNLPLLDLVAKDGFFYTLIEESHESLAGLLVLLVGIHTGAALLHHFFERDDILLRMSPVCLGGWLNRLRRS